MVEILRDELGDPERIWNLGERETQRTEVSLVREGVLEDGTKNRRKVICVVPSEIESPRVVGRSDLRKELVFRRTREKTSTDRPTDDT